MGQAGKGDVDRIRGGAHHLKAPVDTISRELDTDKRARMQQALAQKMYDDYRGVMLGMRSLTWAVSKKVNAWRRAARAWSVSISGQKSASNESRRWTR